MYLYSKHLKIFFYIILYTVLYCLNSNIYQEVKFKIKGIFENEQLNSKEAILRL